MLKPDGLFFATCPAASSPWAWGDPSHTRIIGPECLVFLSQPNYAQVGISPMSDFRFVYRADFDLIHSQTVGHHFEFVLAPKAIRIEPFGDQRSTSGSPFQPTPGKSTYRRCARSSPTC
jgi:hypothetical protein